MIMSIVYTVFAAGALLCALYLGNGPALAAAIPAGAQAGVMLTISLAGSLCLWSGLGKLMERLGLTRALAGLLKPILSRLFPSTRQDPELANTVSGNICANLLGLGNAATPMGIRAAKRMAGNTGVASDELCRFIVLNTASIQLIPSTVAAIRADLGSAQPFSILPQVWVTSLCAAGAGLGAAYLFGRGK